MLAHDLIRRDIEITDLHLNVTHSADQIHNYTQQLKHRIYNALNGDTVGKIVYIDTNNFFIVVCSMLASWELGASIFLNDNDIKTKSLPYFQKFYQVIDIVIGFSGDKNWTPKTATHMSTDRYLTEKKQFHEVVDLPLSKPITPETVCYYTTSSGTTADPKILPFTHFQTVTTSNEISQYLELSEDERPYHYKTLHHTSLFNSYALPLLSKTKTHFCGHFAGWGEEFLTTLTKHISEQKITHFLVPFDWLQRFSKIEAVDFERPLTLITIQGNSNDEMKQLFAKFNIKQVVNYFGSSEVGTTFISRTTKDNVNKYNPNRFVDATSYLDLELHKNYFKVKWKHINEWYTINDKLIKETDGSIWLYGRDIRFDWQGQEIELSKLQELVQQQLSTKDFIIVPDHQLEKIYLNLYNKEISKTELETLNVLISKQFGDVFQVRDCFSFSPEELQFGMKINGPLLLYLFRERAKCQN